jgi:hypothetical protein
MKRVIALIAFLILSHGVALGQDAVVDDEHVEPLITELWMAFSGKN